MSFRADGIKTAKRPAAAEAHEPSKKPKGQRICSICNENKDAHACFSKNQRRKGTNKKCKDCIVAQQVAQQTMYWCFSCTDTMDTLMGLTKKQRKQRNKKCAACVLKKVEADNERNIARKARKLALALQQQRQHILKNVRQEQRRGIANYEFPGWQWNEESSVFLDLAVDTLPGDYEIIYYANRNKESAVQTTSAKRKLRMTQDAGGLSCQVDKVDESMLWSGEDFVVEWEDAFSLIENSKEGRAIFFDMTQLPIEYGGESEDVTVRLMVLGDCMALPWIPTDYYAVEHADGDALLKELAQAPFETVKQAEKAVAAASTVPSYMSTLAQSIDIPTEIAPRIHQYVTGPRPPPAIFFEKGDLCLHVDWDGDNDGLQETYYIARRIPQKAAKKQEKKEE